MDEDTLNNVMQLLMQSRTGWVSLEKLSTTVKLNKARLAKKAIRKVKSAFVIACIAHSDVFDVKINDVERINGFVGLKKEVRSTFLYVKPYLNAPVLNQQLKDDVKECFEILKSEHNLNIEPCYTSKRLFSLIPSLYEIIVRDLGSTVFKNSSWRRIYQDQSSCITAKMQAIAHLYEELTKINVDLDNANYSMLLNLLVESLSQYKKCKENILQLQNEVSQKTQTQECFDDKINKEEIKVLKNRIAVLEAALNEKNEQDMESAAQETFLTNYQSGSPQELIECIRKERGVELIQNGSDDVKHCMKSLYRTLNSAVSKLAEDIYSSRSRFLYELLQNADDNYYSQGVKPTLFIDIDLSSRYILVLNNETGFSADNVRAVCDLGGSTKSTSESTTGYKGIGFKSVFSVCRSPVIVSNGYQFEFDSSMGLGYVVPRWINDENLALRHEKLMQNDLTKIFMEIPVEDDGLDSEICSFFNDIDKSVLFLRRIQHLNITMRYRNQQYSKQIALFRDTESLTVQLDSDGNHTSIGFRIFSISLMVPEEFLSERMKSMNVKHTTLTLAFPVELDKDILYPLYSYLPLEPVGFHFIVQGDFELVASRQSVHKSSRWNSYLRDHVSSLFFDCVKNCEFLWSNVTRLLPIASEISDPFWRKVADDCQVLLQDLPCILGESGILRRPCEVVIRQDGQFCVFNSRDLWDCIGVEYVHKSVDPEIVAQKFGVGRLELKHELQALSSVTGAHLVEMKSFEDIDALYSHLIVGLQQIKSFDDREACLEYLYALKIIPLKATECFSSIADGEVYFDMDSPLRFDVGVRIMKSHSWGNLSKDFLQCIGVHTLNCSDVIESIRRKHSLAILQNESDFDMAHLRNEFCEHIRFLHEMKISEQIELLVPNERGTLSPGNQLVLADEIYDFLPIDLKVDVVDSVLQLEYASTLSQCAGVTGGVPDDSPQMQYFSIHCNNPQHIWSFLRYVYKNWHEGRMYCLSSKVVQNLKGCILNKSFLHSSFDNEIFSFIPRERLCALPSELETVEIFRKMMKDSKFLDLLGIFHTFEEASATELLEIANSCNLEVSFWRQFYKQMSAAKLGYLVKDIHCSGGYFPKKTCIYEANEDIAKLCSRHIIAKTYPTLKEFFVEQAGVAATLDIRSYVCALHRIRKQRFNVKSGHVESFTNDELMNLLDVIYAGIDARLSCEQTCSRDTLPLLTISSGFCQAYRTFIDDKPEFSNLFDGHIDIVHPIISKRQNLCNFFNIQRLSTSIKTQMLKSSLNSCKKSDTLTSTCRRAIKSAKILFSSKTECKDQEDVSCMNVCTVPDIRIDCRLFLHAQGKSLQRVIDRDFYYDKATKLLFLKETEPLSSNVLQEIIPWLSHDQLQITLSYNPYKRSLEHEESTEALDMELMKRVKVADDMKLSNFDDGQVIDCLEKSLRSEDLMRSDVIARRQVEMKPSVKVSPEYLKAIGNRAEYFVFLLIQKWHKERGTNSTFSQYNWVSGGRLKYFPGDNRNVDDTLGYDMFIEDKDNLIQSRYGLSRSAVTWLIEVKGSARRQNSKRFFFSRNELEQSERATRDHRRFRYLVVGVCFEPEPHISFWLEDPYDMYRRDRLRLSATNYEVTL